MDTYDDGAGYKHIRIMPHPGGGFTNATANLQTYYGNLSSGWEVKDGKTYYNIEIPANTTADIFLPATQAQDITEADKPLPQDIIGKTENGYVGLKVGSGIYHFAVNGVPPTMPVLGTK